MKKPKKTKKTKKASKRGVCDECEVREGDRSKKELFQCLYCKKWFCKTHLEPRLSVFRSFIGKIKDPTIRDKIDKEWKKRGGHPDTVWTKSYIDNLKLKKEEDRKEFFDMLDKSKPQRRHRKEGPSGGFSLPIFEPSIYEGGKKRHKFRFKTYPENIDSWVIAGLMLCIISLLLPWISVSFGYFEGFGGQFGVTWFTSFQTEVPKIQSRGLLNYIQVSDYTTIALNVIIPLGFVVALIGLAVRKNSIIFIGSLFKVIPALIFLNLLSQGVSAGGISVTLIGLAGYGFWGFFVGSILMSYNSGKKISGSKILISLIVVAIISFLLLSNFEFSLSTSLQGAGVVSSYPEEEAKIIIEQEIRDYLTPQYEWSQRSVQDLTAFPPIISGDYGGYTVCDSGTYSCSYGKAEGQNVNLLYCSPSYFSDFVFCYKKTITSQSGQIERVIRGCVNSFVFDPEKLQVVSIDFGPLNDMAIGC